MDMMRAEIKPYQYLSKYLIPVLYVLMVMLSSVSMYFTPIELYALPTINQLLPNEETIEILANKSVIVKLNENAESVSVVNPEIADVHIVEPRQILITAVSVGETSLIIWTVEGKTRMIDVTVKWNTGTINQTLKEMLPDEGIVAYPAEKSVVLGGTVKNINSVEKALELTKSYVPDVVNMMKVPGEQQVMLKVKIAEVASSFRHEEGFNFLYSNNDLVTGSKLNNLMSGNFGPGGEVTMSDAVTTFFSIPDSDVSMFIQALKEKGWLEILAEPNLVARSGEQASFLAGGEFPVPVAQGGLNDAITIEYKEFGVRLQFTPTVIDANTIHLDIAPEVSDLDFGNGISFSGFTIPVMITRRAHTVVQLDEGQTFAIAGLISKSKQKVNGKVPYLGDVPIIGGLFKRKEITEDETELLIMVTPYLVAPLEQGERYNLSSPMEWENLETSSIHHEY